MDRDHRRAGAAASASSSSAPSARRASGARADVALEKPPHELPLESKHRAQDGFFALLPWLAAGYLLMICAGIAVFHSGAVRPGSRVSLSQATFTSINAATLTGFQQSVAVESYPPADRMALLIITFCGGLMILVAGGCALTRIARLPYSDELIAACAAGCLIAVAGAGAAIFYNRQHQPFEAALDGALQSLCAFCNSGLAPSSPSVFSRATHLVLLPLAVLGGLGIPVLIEIFERLIGIRRFSRHALRVLSVTGAIYLIGFLVFLILQIAGTMISGATSHPRNWTGSILSASVLTVNSRTLGLPFAFPFENAPRTWAMIQWTMMLFMIVGASPGSCGGGIKGNTLVELWMGIRSALAGRGVPRIFGIAARWVIVYFALVFVVLLCLLAGDPEISGERALSLAISAVSNVGYSAEAPSPSATGQYALAAGMLFGRLIPIGFLWWTVSFAPEADIAVA